MMNLKILDKYILKSYLRRLVLTFLVLMFIFFFHTIWLFIQELAGKDVGIANILKFLIYYAPGLTYITLPLAVIIASIMTFGALAENSEFVAIKASGISVSRAMQSPVVVMVLFGGFAFYIANNLIPASEKRNYEFQYNISRAKPALAIKEGVFSELGSINIRVDEKYGENNDYLKNVIIHSLDKSRVNRVVIKSNYGQLVSDEPNDIVQLILKDGYYYEDINSKNYSENMPHVKVKFETYILNVDISGLRPDTYDESKHVNTYRMMNTEQLSRKIDSLQEDYRMGVKNFTLDIYRRTMIIGIDSGIAKAEDTTGNSFTVDKLMTKLQPGDRVKLLESAISDTESIFRILEDKHNDLTYKKRVIVRHIISYQDKFSLAFACLILFITAAPLGAIVKKGGIGLPMVIAIVLFLTYHFTGMLSRNIAEGGGMNPILSSWISNIIILPLGVYLTYKVTSDRGFVNRNKLFIRDISKKKSNE